MTRVKDAWVLQHFDWYTHETGKGYIPTDKAPPEAVEAINGLNEYISRKYGKEKPMFISTQLRYALTASRILL